MREALAQAMAWVQLSDIRLHLENVQWSDDDDAPSHAPRTHVCTRAGSGWMQYDHLAIGSAYRVCKRHGS